MSDATLEQIKFYRFRSVKSVLDWGEIEEEYIYFSPIKDLNDPMEGHVNLTFRGDNIVWANFFKIYIFSVYSFWLRLIFSGQSISKEMEAEDIYVRFDPELKKSLDKVDPIYIGICKEFFDNDVIKELLGLLDSIEAELTKIEMMPLMFYVHVIILNKLNTVSNSHNINYINPSCEAVLNNFYNETTAVKQIKLIIEQYKNCCDANVDYGFFINEATDIEEKIIKFESEYYGFPIGKNIALLLRFPKIYLEKIVKLITPEFYIASFAITYKNPLMWVHYADSGKGVCLIYAFDFNKEDNNYYITPEVNQNEPPTVSYPLQMREVKYIDHIHEVPDIEFFTGLVPNQLINGDHWFGPIDKRSKIHNKHWSIGGKQKKEEFINKIFNVITSKYKDFEYEHEYRAVYSTFSPGGSGIPESGQMKYNFNNLAGIIFGIRTSEKDKYEITRIIKEKCIKYNRRNFDFYQAKINNEGKVENYKIDIKLI